MRRPTEKEAQELGGIAANDVAGSLGERAGYSGTTRSNSAWRPARADPAEALSSCRRFSISSWDVVTSGTSFIRGSHRLFGSRLRGPRLSHRRWNVKAHDAAGRCVLSSFEYCGWRSDHWLQLDCIQLDGETAHHHDRLRCEGVPIDIERATREKTPRLFIEDRRFF